MAFPLEGSMKRNQFYYFEDIDDDRALAKEPL